jgi:peptide/nickel transport system permease protein
MSESPQATPQAQNKPKKAESASRGVGRVMKYMAVRLVTLFITVVIGVYLTILIANMGGYVDQIRRGEIQEAAQQRVLTDQALKNLPPEARTKRLEEIIKLEEKRYGLDKPFVVRSMGYLSDAVTLSLGRSQNISSDSGSRQVRLILLERLPATVLLFGTADLLLFFVSLFIGLALSRRYGSFWDKFIVTLSPLSAAPGWFFGIFLIAFFSAYLRILPFGGMVAVPPPDNRLDYFISLLYHMILPVLAITVSSIFISAYGNRTFFLIYSSEDYVEMAKAKGLKSQDVERRYVLRPTLPTIITGFAFTLIGLWTGAPIFETVFNWPGLGRVIFQAVGLYDTPVIVASVVLFAYLLAITVFLLDFIYALVDPRVKIGGEGKSA